MNTERFLVLFVTKKTTWVLFASLVILILSLTLNNYYIGIPVTLFTMSLILYIYKNRNSVKNQFDKYIESVSNDIESIAKNTMLLLAVPIVVISKEGEVFWKNSFFSSLFSEKQNERESIYEILKKIEAIEDEEKKHYEIKIEIKEEISIGNCHYRIVGRMIDSFDGKNQQVYILYFFEDTEVFDLKNKLNDEKTVIGLIVIDNYEDLMQSFTETKRPQMLAEIDSKLIDWSSGTEGILRKFERDKYLFIFQKKYLKEMEEKRFDILENIKEINIGNKIPVTLSIGIDTSADDFSKSIQYASASLEIALGRGGDQVVVRNGERIQFYGGKSRELEKRTRVKARVIAHALREVMAQAPQIIIMGHSNCDIDCLGSAVGLYKIAKNLDKKAHIVLSSSNPTIELFLDNISKSELYDDLFIGKSQAIDMITKNTLLIVVDTHRPSYTECPELLKLTHNVVVIDHHRRGADFIQDAVLTYHEPYASSTSELVTEMIQYIEDSVKIDILEAELLFAGIVVDTKGFTFKSGIRTFEAAAYLRQKGVDTMHVKQMLQNDIESFINISNIVREVKIIKNNIAISVCSINNKNSLLIAAQAADQILGISGIVAAFVVADSGNGISINGRSFGEINVQVILEKIGGGGHQTVAGAQFYNESLESVAEKLNTAIEDYLKESSKDS